MEAQGVVRLPEQDVTTFKCFVRWVYTNRLRGFHYPNTKLPLRTRLEQDAVAEATKREVDGYTSLPWNNPVRERLDMADFQDLPLQLLVRLYILAEVLQVHG